MTEDQTLNDGAKDEAKDGDDLDQAWEDEEAREREAAEMAGFETRIYRTLYACRSVDEMAAGVGRILRDLSFDSFAFFSLGTDGKRFDVPHRLIAALPEKLITAYDAKRYHEWDIIFDYAFHNRRPAYYATLRAELARFPYGSQMKEINREIFGLYLSHGYADFYLVPCGVGGRKALLKVGIRDVEAAELTCAVRATEQQQVSVAIE